MVICVFIEITLLSLSPPEHLGLQAHADFEIENHFIPAMLEACCSDRVQNAQEFEPHWLWQFSRYGTPQPLPVELRHCDTVQLLRVFCFVCISNIIIILKRNQTFRKQRTNKNNKKNTINKFSFCIEPTGWIVTIESDLASHFDTTRVRNKFFIYKSPKKKYE